MSNMKNLVYKFSGLIGFGVLVLGLAFGTFVQYSKAARTEVPQANNLVGIVPVANGGTATSTPGVTGGIEYFNGNFITNGAALITDGNGGITQGSGATLWTIEPDSTNGNALTATTSALTYAPFLITTSGNVGIGSTSPNANLSIMDTGGFVSQAPTNIFTIASSSQGNATSTLFNLDSLGQMTITSNVYPLSVGATGAINPAFQVDASTTNAVSGIRLTSVADAGQTILQAIGSGANESLTLRAEGSGSINLDTNSTAGNIGLKILGGTKFGVTSSGATVTDDFTVNDAASSGAGPRINFNTAADTNLATSTASIFARFNNAAQTRTWGGGIIVTESDEVFNSGNHAFAWYNAGANNFTNLNTVEADYPLTPATGNGTTTNASAIYIPTTALNASTTNAFGVRVAAPTAATNNYAASTTGRVIMSGLAVDSADVAALCLTSTGEVEQHATTGCVTSARRFKTDIADLSDSTSLAQVLSMQPVTFQYKPGDGPTGAQVGFIADDVLAADPSNSHGLVVMDSNGDGLPNGFNYQQFTAMLDGAIKAQQQEIEALKAPVVAVAHDAQDKWQWLLIGLLVLWVFTLEIRLRRK